MPCYICRTTRKAYINRENNVKLHVFPTSRPMILEEWKKFACVPDEVDITRIMLCTRHFKEEDIIARPLKTTLLKTAIPCLLPPKNQEVCSVAGVSVTSDVNEQQMSDPQNYSVSDSTESPFFKEEEETRAEYPEECSDHLDGQQVLETVRKQLCRVCGKKEALLMPIFETSEETCNEMPLVMKIEMYLPIKVEDSDGMPPNICSNCLGMVHYWHELHVACLSADSVLRRIFCNTEDETVAEFTDEPVLNVNASMEDETKMVLDIEDYTFPGDDSNHGDPTVQVSTDYVVPVEERINMEYLESADTESDLLKNNKTTTCVKPFLPSCHYCHEIFNYRDDCNSHMNECQELSALCDMCGEEVPHRKHLGKHKRKHVQRKLQSFVCEKCAKCIHSSRALQYHLAFVHDKTNPPEYCCEACCKVIYTKFYYQLHMKKHALGKIKSTRFSFEPILENNDSAVYLCPVCEEIFSDKMSLIIHLNTQRLVKCPTCQKLSQNEKKFMLHKCRKWYCHDCAKPFNNKHAFEAHLHIHEEASSTEDNI